MQKGPAPEELVRYLEERRFWSELGVPSTSDPLDEWIEEKVRRYGVIMDAVAAWEQAEMKLAQRRAEIEAKHR